MEEVEKLLTTRFIREVYYPKWLVLALLWKRSPMENGECV